MSTEEVVAAEPGRRRRVLQEFRCRECPADQGGGETGGYFRLSLSTGYDAEIIVVCPKCGHEHQRFVIDGTIRNANTTGRHLTEDRIRAPLSAWSREPVTNKLAKALTRIQKERSGTTNFSAEVRDGSVIAGVDDVVPSEENVRRFTMSERWLRLARTEQGGEE